MSGGFRGLHDANSKSMRSASVTNFVPLKTVGTQKASAHDTHTHTHRMWETSRACKHTLILACLSVCPQDGIGRELQRAQRS